LKFPGEVVGPRFSSDVHASFVAGFATWEFKTPDPTMLFVVVEGLYED